MKQILTPSLLALAVSSACALPAQAQVVLSQYIEGSSYNKAIEIANTGDQAVSLDGLQLAKSRNGNGNWEDVMDLTGQAIAAGGTLVIANSQASAEILALSDVTNNSVTSFNGDDPLALLKADGSVHDMLGVMGDVDWGKDKTLIRNQDAMAPSATFQQGQWSALGKDSLEGLGSAAGSAAPAPFACLTDTGETPQFTTIQQIQGEGSRSPYISGYPYITDQQFYLRGVVSAVTGGLTKGFYLQALESDYNPQTSDGLFVYTNQAQSDLAPGDVVCVKGQVQEYYNLTQLKAQPGNWIKQDHQPAPEAQTIEILPSDQNFAETLERYEGMLVATTEALDMRVTRTFGYDYAARRNNLVLAQGRINMQPNQLYPAGSELAQQQSVENAQRRLFVESDQKAADGQIPYYPQFGRSDADQDGSTEDYLRVDDTLVGLEGVLSYSYGEYRLIATNLLSQDNVRHNTPRTDEPEMYQGDLRIASFNVLNYFNSPFNGNSNPHGDNRGADNYQEFERQQAKIVEALLRLDADIVGLMEVENNGFGDGAAIQQLVDQLNGRIDDKKRRYAVVGLDSNGDGEINDQDYIGSDVITTGVIYRPKVVKLTEARVIAMPSQHAPEVRDEQGKLLEDGNNYQRNTLAPTFKIKGSKESITVAVNHLKSKGSKCWEDAAPVEQGGQGGQDADLQGSCENFRVAAAVALGEALNTIDGHKVILGDMNSYAMEDPMLVLTDYTPEKYGKTIRAARNTFIAGEPQFGDQGAVISRNFGYLNAVGMTDDQSWSYSYNDEVGALDHMLISPSLRDKLVDATDWHINGGESTLFDYNDEYKGDLPKYQDHFRASDHDPAVLELNMAGSSSLAAIMSLMGIAGWRRWRR
ncbi:ExeM/NucH family extracellular endonuclease [Vibrio sp.]|uniref:ExeM/NucH family extracellular endonuclease n=1 Tax=Vibrio sp. TaxID=678 RepID=UPI003D0DA258